MKKSQVKKLTDVELIRKIDELELKYFLDAPNAQALAKIATLYRKIENPDTRLKRPTGLGKEAEPRWRNCSYTLLHLAIVSGHPQSLVPLVMLKNPNPNLKDQFGDDAGRVAARVAQAGFISKGTINLVYEYAAQWEKEKLAPEFSRRCRKLYRQSLVQMRENT